MCERQDEADRPEAALGHLLATERQAGARDVLWRVHRALASAGPSRLEDTLARLMDGASVAEVLAALDWLRDAPTTYTARFSDGMGRGWSTDPTTIASQRWTA